jgi:hypothetical protein
VNDRFELEVAGMLAARAKVDRSTVELTRASIAALPDRGSSRRAGFGLRLPGLSVRLSPALSLVGVGALLVAIVAVSLFGRFQSAPLGPSSPTPPTATPLRTATASPSVTPTPTSTDRPPQAFHETLPVVYTGERMGMLGWSPDGSAFAIIDRPRGSALMPPVPTVHLFDRSGVEIGSVDGWEFAWTGPTSFVVLRYEAVPGAADTAQGHAYLGRIGSTQLDRLSGTYDNIVAGPSGAVALMLPWDGTLATPAQYVVVSGASVSDPRDGYPTAWSRDGSMLAVFHPTWAPAPGGGGGGEATGWLDVVRSTGESVASARQIESAVSAQAAFSPDGARVAFRDDTNAAGQGEQIGVLEVASGRLSSIPKFGLFTWASTTDLLFVDLSSSIPSQNNHIYSWSATTGLLAAYGTGMIVGASGQGAVVVGMDVTPALTWTNTTPGAAGSGAFSLGAGPWMGIPDAAWSPDGTSLVLISGDGMEAFMDAVLAQF